MPVSLARQVEFWRGQFAPNSDIKIKHLLLTREQADHYDLPGTPIKDSDLRKRAFEERHGEGGVELDALEATRPGEFVRLLEEAIQPYFDKDLESRLEDAEGEAAQQIQEEWESEIEEVTQEVEQIRKEAQRVSQRFAARAKRLSDEFNKEMSPLRQRLGLASQAFEEKLQNFSIALPERPDADLPEVDESDWLYDRFRGYLDQIEAYKRHKGDLTDDDKAA